MKSQITIKKIQELLIKGGKNIYVDDDTSRRMWWASLEVIQKDFLSQNYKDGGIWVASPLPAFNEKKFLNQLHGWLWSPEGFPYFQNENAGFLPVYNSEKIKKDFDLVKNIDFSEICITSSAQLEETANDEIKIETNKAEGSKCSLCWKIKKDKCPRQNCPV